MVTPTILLALLLLGGDPLERKQPVYTHPTGWAIASVKPAADLIRWNKFENGMNTCGPCMAKLEAKGLLKTFRRFYMDGVHHWWAFMLDIPHGTALAFDQDATLQMYTVHKGDTTVVYSTQFIFPVGWDPWPQHTERSTTVGPVNVWPCAYGDGPTNNDYEWARFRYEWDDLPKYYVLGYARYTQVPKGTQVQWRMLGVTSYERR